MLWIYFTFTKYCHLCQSYCFQISLPASSCSSASLLSLSTMISWSLSFSTSSLSLFISDFISSCFAALKISSFSLSNFFDLFIIIWLLPFQAKIARFIIKLLTWNHQRFLKQIFNLGGAIIDKDFSLISFTCLILSFVLTKLLNPYVSREFPICLK